MNSLKGFIYGIITSVTFGLIPLFTIPLIRQNLSHDSILFYRFGFATIALAVMLKIHKQSFNIKWKELPGIIILSLFYMASSLFLLWGYDFMGAGAATTIHFTYPVFVTLIMLLIFHEKTSWVTWFAIFLAVYGVAKLSLGDTTQDISLLGIGIVLLSAIGYGSYIVMANKSSLKQMHNRKLAFFVFLFTTVFLAVKSMFGEGIQAIPNLESVMNFAALAILPTVLSNITLLLAIHHIGGTTTSVLGALEPVTAVLIGVAVFNESFTIQQGFGIAMILIAVTLIILGKPIQNTLSTAIKMIRPRHA